MSFKYLRFFPIADMILSNSFEDSHTPLAEIIIYFILTFIFKEILGLCRRFPEEGLELRIGVEQTLVVDALELIEGLVSTLKASINV
jgi:hypothetical protein